MQLLSVNPVAPLQKFLKTIVISNPTLIIHYLSKTHTGHERCHYECYSATWPLISSLRVNASVRAFLRRQESLRSWETLAGERFAGGPPQSAQSLTRTLQFCATSATPLHWELLSKWLRPYSDFSTYSERLRCFFESVNIIGGRFYADMWFSWHTSPLAK